MTITIRDLDTFTRAYVETALWSSHDDDGEPLEGLYSIDDVGDQALARMAEDCQDFQRANAADLEGRDPGRAGQDFWLTRNRHGAGFWDGDYPHDVGKRLTRAAHAYGSCDLYAGDNGLIHAQ